MCVPVDCSLCLHTGTDNTMMSATLRAPCMLHCKSQQPLLSCRGKSSRLLPTISCQASAHRAAKTQVSKRQMLSLAASVVVSTFAVPAFAFEPREGSMKQAPQLLNKYYSETDDVLKHLHQILDIEGTPDSDPELVKAFKKDSSEWVADYRRLISPGRKSYAETYGAISALQGHFNSTGYDRKLPKKLRDNVDKRLKSAESSMKREVAKLEQATTT